MIRILRTARLLVFTLGIMLTETRADELSPAQSSPDDVSIDAATAAAKWEHAVAEVERVDTEFTQYTYDLISETVILSDGRLVCETGGRHFLSLKCAVAKAPSRIKKRSGQSFNVIPGRWERWIRNDTRILSFDDDKKEAWTFAVKRHEGTSVPPTEQKW